MSLMRLFTGVSCCCCSTDTEISPTDCSDGAVRLVNGNNSLEGRLEVCFNRVWGTVCDSGFNADDAQVICNQLMVPYQGECTFYLSYYHLNNFIL